MTVLGSLPYLNVRPLVYTFEHGKLPDGWTIEQAPPAKLAARLLAGDMIAAPVSSFAVLGSEDLAAVPGVGISAPKSAKSVLLLSRVPFEQIRSVALDSGSLTGAAKTKILLTEMFGLSPEYKTADPDPSAMLHDADAALLIGDTALRFKPVGLRVLDIGQAWRELTGLPAVFALWAGRRDLLTPKIAARLLEARDQGIAKIDRIVETEAPRLGLLRSFCREYLKENMRYGLAEDELASLERFGDLALKHGLIQRAGVRFCDVG